MSMCFTWFLIGGYRKTQYIPELGLNYNVCGNLLGGLSDCEELVGHLMEHLGINATNYFMY